MIEEIREQHEMDCKDAQEKVVARREGWLSPADATAFDAHVAVCEECRRHLEADARLVAALDAMPQRDVPAPSWAQVAAGRRARRTGLPAWTIVPAVGAALASAALLWITLSRPANVVAPPVTAVADSLRDTAPAAHLLMGASDVGSDPNRAVLALSTLRTGGQ